jgi:hypothetical protein
MSGVFPGTRTQQYQRLRLRSVGREAAVRWSQLRWYTDPASVALFARDDPAGQATPLWRAEPPPAAPELALTLAAALAARNQYAEACFACQHFQPVAGVSEDGLPIGRCGWGQGDETTAAQVPTTLAVQSALALACDQFLPNLEPSPVATAGVGLDASRLRVPKSAELDADRLPFWPRLWRRLAERWRGPQESVSWAEQLVERSGVGAGTESCFVCQGRLANLGALAVATPEGDKQTFSVWRCRSCFSVFLNDWTDRWERLDSLETEESVYRLAPAEAYAALTIVHATAGGDHPAGRDERRQQRAQMHALVVGKSPLAHQIRQGR